MSRFRPLSGIMFSIAYVGNDLSSVLMVFPSPLGDYVFNRTYFSDCKNAQEGFRPLSGIMFSIRKVTDETIKAIMVSVPSRGLCFQSNERRVCIGHQTPFPSPLGDYVFNRLLKEAENMTKLKFPSPLGDYVFNLTSFELALTIRLCFRPLSGIMFSIQKYVIKERKDNNVSVPSRGLCFQSISWQCGTTTHKKFPSPLGDYVFNRLLLQKSYHWPWLFPSPLGDYVFNHAVNAIMHGSFSVSVPSRGLCFQS